MKKEVKITAIIVMVIIVILAIAGVSHKGVSSLAAAHFSGKQYIIDDKATAGATYISISNSMTPKTKPQWRIMRIMNGVITSANGDDGYKWKESEKTTYDYSIPEE